MGLRHENPLMAGNWDWSGSGSWVGKTLMNGLLARRALMNGLLTRRALMLNRVLTLKRNGGGNLRLLAHTHLLSVLCCGNTLFMVCLAHKLAAIHATNVCRLILTPILCIGLEVNAELDVLTLDQILVSIT